MWMAVCDSLWRRPERSGVFCTGCSYSTFLIRRITWFKFNGSDPSLDGRKDEGMSLFNISAYYLLRVVRRFTTRTVYGPDDFFLFCSDGSTNENSAWHLAVQRQGKTIWDAKFVNALVDSLEFPHFTSGMVPLLSGVGGLCANHRETNFPVHSRYSVYALPSDCVRSYTYVYIECFISTPLIDCTILSPDLGLGCYSCLRWPSGTK